MDKAFDELHSYIPQYGIANAIMQGCLSAASTVQPVLLAVFSGMPKANLLVSISISLLMFLALIKQSYWF